MKRKKVIKVNSFSGQVTVTIDVDGTGHLSRSECNDVAEKLTDKVMLALANDVPYINTSLSKIKVS